MRVASTLAILAAMTSTAYAGGVDVNALTATVTVVFALVAHAGINVLNDYYDARNGTDAIKSKAK